LGFSVGISLLATKIKGKALSDIGGL